MCLNLLATRPYTFLIIRERQEQQPMMHQQQMCHAKEDLTKQSGKPRLVELIQHLQLYSWTALQLYCNCLSNCSLTCPEDWCVSRSSSWHAAPARPGRGSRAAAGRGCPAVGAPPGWTPCPAERKRSGYTNREFAQGEVHKINKKADHSDSCVSHHSLRLGMSHTRAQIQWSFWCFLQIMHFYFCMETLLIRQLWKLLQRLV